MQKDKDLTHSMAHILKQTLGNRATKHAFPPPVFTVMRGKFLALDVVAGTLIARFPLRKTYENPFGTMQGGMLAAAIDNTIGPLSMLVAPENITRTLTVTYNRPVALDQGAIVITARFISRVGRKLYFKAEVCDQQGTRLARAKAVHWITAATR